VEVKTNPTSLLCGDRNGHHNTELRTQRLIIGKHKKLKNTKAKKMSNTDPTIKLYLDSYRREIFIFIT